MPEQTLDTRRLGHVILCGALHVITQSLSGDVPHEYMACMLYKSYLIIATTSVAANYEVKFAIRLALAHIEEADTGKGRPFLDRDLHSSYADYCRTVFPECSTDMESCFRGERKCSRGPPDGFF